MSEHEKDIAVPGSTFRLIPESRDGEASVPEIDHFEVGEGVSFFRAARGEAPRFEQSRPELDSNVVLLEPVIHADDFRLLLVNPEEAEIRINDQVAPHVILLRASDQIRINFGSPLEVAVYNVPFIGKPPADLVGETCPLCRLKITEKTRVFRCPYCRAGLHLEEGDDETALKCAALSPVCGGCNHPVQFAEGYLTKPEFSDE